MYENSAFLRSFKFQFKKFYIHTIEIAKKKPYLIMSIKYNSKVDLYN